MKIKFNTRKSIISLIIILAMCSSIFMISASALSAESTAITISEETLAKAAKAIAEKKGVSVDDIEVRVVSAQKISVDEFAALQNHNHSSLSGSSANMVQSFASEACCSNPNLTQYTLEARIYTYNASSYCHTWEDWSCVQCYNCGYFEALYRTGAAGTRSHSYSEWGICVYCSIRR